MVRLLCAVVVLVSAVLCKAGDLEIGRVFPRVGSQSGLTDVTLVATKSHFGAEAKDSFRCKFGEHIVSGVRISKSQVKCSSPKAKEPGKVDLFLSMNEEKWVPAGSFTYSKNTGNLSVKSIFSVARLSPSSGPVSGGTQVEVYGDGFGKRDELFACQFVMTGALPLKTARQAVRRSAQSLMCVTPRVAAPGTAWVFLSRNGEHFVNTTASFAFDLDAPRDGAEVATVGSVLPSSGPVTGGTQVVITGLGFGTGNRDVFTCKFSFTADKVLTTNGFRQSATRVQCTTPASLLPPGPVSVSLILNGKALKGPNLVFDYLAAGSIVQKDDQPVTLKSVFPNSGPVTGGTQLQVIGSGFGTGDRVFFRCRVGSTVVPARRVSDAELSCTTPPSGFLLPVKAGVAIQRNDEPFTTEVDFTYLLDKKSSEVGVPVLLAALSPSAGPVSGGTHVYARGTGFGTGLRDEVTCHFGSISTEGMRLSTEFIRCTSPKFERAGPQTFTVRVNDAVASGPLLTFEVVEDTEFFAMMTKRMTEQSQLGYHGDGQVAASKFERAATDHTLAKVSAEPAPKSEGGGATRVFFFAFVFLSVAAYLYRKAGTGSRGRGGYTPVNA